jgi:hypothetical protein
MPAQGNDAACILCHEVSGTSLDVVDAHLHPLLDPTHNPGLNVTVTAVTEAGSNDGDGTFDPGEKIQVTFDLEDDEGDPVTPGELGSFFAVVAGPTNNQSLVSYESFAAAALTGTSPYTTFLPERIQLEPVGDSTGALGEVFTTARSPHWNVAGATTDLWLASPSGPSTTVTVATTDSQNYIDVDVGDGALFTRGEYAVIDEGGGSEEYVRIQTIDGDRIWFSSPYTSSYKASLVFNHAVGTSVRAATLASIDSADYSVNTTTGDITEVNEFGTGPIIASYTTDFVIPTRYPGTFNDTPNLDDSWGDWSGKTLVDGTYTVTLWGYRNLSVVLFGETNSYRGTSLGGTADFLVGDATTLDPYDLISSEENCYQCHEEIFFHGGSRRGFQTCLACHGTLGAEDRAPYVAANAPDDDVTVSFRTMLHKIHMGEELTNATSYVIAGFSTAPYPNNFTPHTYEHVVFPAAPGAVKQCSKCHGDTNDSWTEPSDRTHPTEQNTLIRAWRSVCGACHDSNAAVAHIDGQTAPNGGEACAICHGPGKDWEVEKMHSAQ